MQTHKYIAFSILASLVLQGGCGEDFSGGSRVIVPQQEELSRAPFPEVFRTRLNSSLLLSGDRCRGEETTEPNGHGSLCEAGNYLIYIDDINICDSSGSCTDFVVTPIIGRLEDTDARDQDTRFFFIIPKSLTTSTQKNILENVVIESDLNGNGFVFFRLNWPSSF